MVDWREKWHLFEGSALAVYIKAIAGTAHMHIDRRNNYETALASGRPVIFTYWHQQVKPFVSFAYRFLQPSQFVVIVVGDERGSILAQVGAKLGANYIAQIDMGGNPMAAGRGVLNIIKAMRGGGKFTLLAPDGPDGPVYVPKKGVTFLAQKSEAAIVPFGGWTRQAAQLPRWDRYLVPFPFCHLHLTFGKPIYTDRNQESAELEATIVDALHAARRRAMNLAGAKGD